MKEVIEKLHKNNFKLGIATSNWEPLVKEKLRIYGIPNIFNSIVGYRDNLKLKPHPEFIQVCINELEIPPRETVYVGDLPFDVLAAKAAGVPVICVTWGYAAEETLRKAGPNYIVKTPEQLLEMINKSKNI